MAKTFDITAVCKAVKRSPRSVWDDRANPSCPLHGDGMRRPRAGRRLVATPEVLAAYKAWLCELVPAAATKDGAA